MNTKPPIKCTPCRVTYNNVRYRIYSDGSVSGALSADEAGKLGIKNAKEALEYEFNTLPRYDPYSTEARTIRQHAAKLRRNRNARERYQAHKDLGLNRTPSGQWE